MKKLFKILLIIIVNLLLLLITLLISDRIVYNAEAKPDRYYSLRKAGENIPPFSYYINNPEIMFVDFDNFFVGGDNFFKGRRPDGLKYYNKTPIVCFGDSYMFGQYLEPEQTFPHKLSEALKRPVYNRAVSGTAFATMYYQVASEEYSPTFYREVPPSDTVFYMMINHHWWRTLTLGDTYVIGKLFYMRYTPKKGKLVMDNYKNKLYNFIKSSYTIRYLNLKYIDWYVNRGNSAERLTDLAMAYFLETRRILEEEWNRKIKFVVIFYQATDIVHRDLLKRKLVDNDFIVIDTKDLTDADLDSDKYMMKDNKHPTEELWNMLTPKIIEQAGL